MPDENDIPETEMPTPEAANGNEPDTEIEEGDASPVADDDKLQAVAQPTSSTEPHLAALMDAFNENTRKLNSRLFTYMDYAIVARR